MFNMIKMGYSRQLNGANIIQLPKNLDRRGNLSVVEEITNIPFEIKRTYWIYDVPGGAVRGGHAYRNNEEFIVALSGSFDVVLDNGLSRTTYSLNRSYYGLYIPKGVWRQMVNFSTNSLALILASIPFDPSDYVYDYEHFKELSNKELEGSVS
jgi:dTDP-4-dehydrorhamnose 3,5-epimerase-like enzyme